MSRDPGLDFSFSGLKTALVYRCRELGPRTECGSGGADLAASFQAAVVGQLRREAGAGAASAASGTRSRSAAASPRTGRCARRWRRSASERGLRLKLVARELCTDNAAMIGSAARFAEPLPYPDYLGYDAFATRRRRSVAA